MSRLSVTLDNFPRPILHLEKWDTSHGGQLNKKRLSPENTYIIGQDTTHKLPIIIGVLSPTRTSYVVKSRVTVSFNQNTFPENTSYMVQVTGQGTHLNNSSIPTTTLYKIWTREKHG